MTVSVRPHVFTAGGLLALAGVLGLATAFGALRGREDLHLLAYLGGLTLLAQGIALWYLPSFTKRDVVLDGMATYAGPILFPAALVGAALRIAALRDPMLLLALVVFPVVVFASALIGPRWRSGIPFWRTPGAHRVGDLLAAVTFACALAWSAAAGVVAMQAPRLLVVAWPTSLGLFALGALAHLVPRSRARPLLPALYTLGLLSILTGGVLATLARGGVATEWARLGYALLAGFLVAAIGLAPPGAQKRGGPRASEARPYAWLACAALALGIAGAAVPAALTTARASTAYYALLAALGLALAALALLALPVAFNQRPDARWVRAAPALALLAAALLCAAYFGALPRWPAAVALVASLGAWLAGMAPLRRPRRAC